MALGLAVALARAAESKQHPLIGATKAQIVARLGEPTSQIVTGNREVLFFDRERFELVDGVVTFAERVAADSPPPPPAAPPSPPPVSSSPRSGGVPRADAGVAVSERAPPPAETVPPRAAAPPVTPPPRETEERLQIKAVRPRGTSASGDVPVGKDSTQTAETASSSSGPGLPETKKSEPERKESGTPASDTTVDARGKKASAPVASPEKKTKVPRPPRPPSDPNFPSPMESVFTTQTYVIAAVVVFGGLGYLMWRYRQRQLELAATTVSQTSFASPASPSPSPLAASGDTTRFTADLLAKLDGKRFEELVAAYYSRTGVVAVLTKAGPTTPVQIKISWKGEPRPFADVRCIAHPTAPIDVKPLKELLTVLAAEDIRRGYVVTTGDFTPEARTFAAAKQLTLLSGETFIEKLNALPEAARKELRRETVAEAPSSA